VNIKHKP